MEILILPYIHLEDPSATTIIIALGKRDYLLIIRDNFYLICTETRFKLLPLIEYLFGTSSREANRKFFPFLKMVKKDGVPKFLPKWDITLSENDKIHTLLCLEMHERDISTQYSPKSHTTHVNKLLKNELHHLH